MSTAPLILPFQGIRPRIHESAYIAPGATIIGDVEIGADSSVFYGCVLRGDVGPIRIGERTNIQDNSVLHANHDSPASSARTSPSDTRPSSTAVRSATAS